MLHANPYGTMAIPGFGEFHVSGSGQNFRDDVGYTFFVTNSAIEIMDVPAGASKGAIGKRFTPGTPKHYEVLGNLALTPPGDNRPRLQALLGASIVDEAVRYVERLRGAAGATGGSGGGTQTVPTSDFGVDAGDKEPRKFHIGKPAGIGIGLSGVVIGALVLAYAFGFIGPRKASRRR